MSVVWARPYKDILIPSLLTEVDIKYEEVYRQNISISVFTCWHTHNETWVSISDSKRWIENGNFSLPRCHSDINSLQFIIETTTSCFYRLKEELLGRGSKQLSVCKTYWKHQVNLKLIYFLLNDNDSPLESIHQYPLPSHLNWKDI